MQMIHLLLPDPPAVDDCPETVRGTRLAGQAARHGQHLPEGGVVLHPGLIQSRHVRLGDDQEVHRGDRADVMKSEDLFILVQLAGRNRPRDDLAEKAVFHEHHSPSRSASFRAAFSSMPEIPSRRCSSARISPGPSP